MTKIDDTTYVMDDTSIVNFFDDGKVELYPSEKSKFKKSKDKNDYNEGSCRKFEYASKEIAMKIFIELEIIQNNENL